MDDRCPARSEAVVIEWLVLFVPLAVALRLADRALENVEGRTVERDLLEGVSK